MDLRTAMADSLKEVAAKDTERRRDIDLTHSQAIARYEQRLRDGSMQVILVQLESVAFKHKSAYAFRLCDTIRQVAVKLERDTKNLKVADMEFGVKCKEHPDSTRRITYEKFDTPLFEVGNAIRRWRIECS